MDHYLALHIMSSNLSYLCAKTTPCAQGEESECAKIGMTCCASCVHHFLPPACIASAPTCCSTNSDAMIVQFFTDSRHEEANKQDYKSRRQHDVQKMLLER
eukprot:1992313-Amphidinium_carterae.1